MGVQSITLSWVSSWGGVVGRAVVVVRNAAGNPVVGARVFGTWSGLVNGTAAANTGADGSATLSSPNVSGQGTATFTVTGITLTGSIYDPGLNAETSDSISR